MDATTETLRVHNLDDVDVLGRGADAAAALAELSDAEAAADAGASATARARAREALEGLRGALGLDDADAEHARAIAAATARKAAPPDDAADADARARLAALHGHGASLAAALLSPAAAEDVASPELADARAALSVAEEAEKDANDALKSADRVLDVDAGPDLRGNQPLGRDIPKLGCSELTSKAPCEVWLPPRPGRRVLRAARPLLLGED